MTNPDINMNISDYRYNKTYDHLIEETRKLLYQKLTTEDKYYGTYYEEDLKLAMNQDRVRRFLLKHNGSVKSTVSAMISSFQWIKKYESREKNDSQFPKEVQMLGTAFSYKHDRAGRLVYYVRNKQNYVNKDLRELKIKYMLHKIIKAYDDAGEPGLVMVLDLAETPITRVELSLITFSAESIYYLPYATALNLCVNLPRIMTGAFKALKYALPEDMLSTLDLITTDELVKYIDIENIPPFLGGKCQIPYSGPSVVPKDSPSIVEFGLKIGMSKDKILKWYSFYREEMKKMRKECSWPTHELLAQLDKSLLLLED